ncbi:MAG TPA: hypothetical protein VF821_26125, partial [Lentzea sp.]
VNLATAGFELARAEDIPVELETALRTLEVAHDRAAALLGADHSTTRVLRHELMLCRQLVFGVDEGGGGEGSVLTRQRTAVAAPFEPFEQEYISIDQAGQVLRQRRTQVALAEHEPRLIEDPATDTPPTERRLTEDPPLTPQCCGRRAVYGSPLNAPVEHDPDCPNHPDNLARQDPPS